MLLHRPPRRSQRGREADDARLTRRHEGTEGLWDDDALLRLVVLQDGAHHAGGGAHGGVEHVHVFGLRTSTHTHLGFPFILIEEISTSASIFLKEYLLNCGIRSMKDKDSFHQLLFEKYWLFVV